MVNENQRNFKDKTACITGGSARNIGLTIARDLASRGASVAIVDICYDLDTVPYGLSSEADLENSVKDLSALGVKTVGLTCDIRNKNQVHNTINRVAEEFGKLDILVNNAGIISLFPLKEMTEKAWNEVLDVRLKGTFFCCKHAVSYMVERNYSKIVNISSVASVRGLGLSIHYAAAKH